MIKTLETKVTSLAGLNDFFENAGTPGNEYIIHSAVYDPRSSQKYPSFFVTLKHRNSPDLSTNYQELPKDMIDLDLPLRARKALRKLGAETTAEMVNLINKREITEHRLLSIKNCGSATIRHITDELAKYGINLPI